jgi:choline dehydrogenase-like flavoprotein
MIYIRGHRADYDEWEALGNAGWGYAGVLPYFRKSENNERLHNDYHGIGGDLNVTQQVQHNPLTKAFVRSCQEIGIPFNADVNGAEQDGVTLYDVTQRKARRESSATAFLRPARQWPNLTVVTRAIASKVLIEAGRAVGVEYVKDEQVHRARANAEVILSGGAVNSPKLLLLSGIGPADELRAVGVDVVHHLPGVGKNFQDHMDVYITAETAPVSYNEEDRFFAAVRHGIQYLLYKTGPMTACVAEAGAFIRSSDAVRSPDIQIHCLPAYVIDHGRMRVRGHGITINTCNLRPRSIGSVRLRSANPLDHPLIDPNFCGDPHDWEISIEGFKWGRKILAAESFAPYIQKEFMPGADCQTDDEIRRYISTWSKTDYHPVGSCTMGSDELAVVDTQLRVHGLQGLRVIDASITGAVDHDRGEGRGDRPRRQARLAWVAGWLPGPERDSSTPRCALRSTNDTRGRRFLPPSPRAQAAARFEGHSFAGRAVHRNLELALRIGPIRARSSRLRRPAGCGYRAGAPCRCRAWTGRGGGPFRPARPQ